MELAQRGLDYSKPPTKGRNLRRLLAVLGAVVLATTTLTACSTADPKLAAFEGITAACTPFKTGAAADQVKISKTINGKPEITFPTPLAAKTVETKVLAEGTGPAFTGNQFVELDFIGLNGNTGKVFQSTSFDNKNLISQYFKSGSDPDFCDALSGVREGSIAAIVYPAKLLHKNQGIASIGIGAKDDVVFVFKLDKVYLPQANGASQPQQDGFPQVVTSADGVPGLVLQNWHTPAFTKLAMETLVKGRGEVVKLGDTVTVNYAGWLWADSKSQFDSSWTNGSPVQFELRYNKLISGFVKALKGQTVGSQVVVVLPPDEAYGSTEQNNIPANSTLIFVIDILGTKSSTTSK